MMFTLFFVGSAYVVGTAIALYVSKYIFPSEPTWIIQAKNVKKLPPSHMGDWDESFVDGLEND